MAERILVTLEESTTLTHCFECRFQDEFHNSYCDVFHKSREYDIDALQFKRLAGCMRARNEAENLHADGRAVGRADVAKYSNAVGRIESALGIAGAKPLGETVATAERLAIRASAALALLDRIVRYHDEDRAVTPGCTRLARVVAEAKAWIRPASTLTDKSGNGNSMADYDGRECEDRPPPWQIDTEAEDV